MDYRYTSDPELAELFAEMELLTPDPRRESRMKPGATK